MTIRRNVALTIDPGITTGFVIGAMYPHQISMVPFQQKMDVQEFESLLYQISPEFIICEDFESRPGPRVELFSVQLIGVVNLYAKNNPETKLVMQKPMLGEGGHFAAPKRREKNKINNLKQYGVYVAGDDYHHAMSAMRHYMQWLYFRGGYQFITKPPQVRVLYNTYSLYEDHVGFGQIGFGQKKDT